MTIDDTIFLANFEKRMIESWKDNQGKLFEGIDPDNYDNVAKLNLKYNHTAENIKNFNYNDKLLTALKEKDIEPGVVSKIRDTIDSAKKLVESDNFEDVYNGYCTLSNTISVLEAGKEFLNAYNHGGEALDSYLKKGTDKWIKKGLNPNDARDKAEKNYIRRAQNLYNATEKNRKNLEKKY